MFTVPLAIKASWSGSRPWGSTRAPAAKQAQLHWSGQGRALGLRQQPEHPMTR